MDLDALFHDHPPESVPERMGLVKDLERRCGEVLLRAWHLRGPYARDRKKKKKAGRVNQREHSSRSCNGGIGGQTMRIFGCVSAIGVRLFIVKGQERRARRFRMVEARENTKNRRERDKQRSTASPLGSDFISSLYCLLLCCFLSIVISTALLTSYSLMRSACHDNPRQREKHSKFNRHFLTFLSHREVAFGSAGRVPYPKDNEKRMGFPSALKRASLFALRLSTCDHPPTSASRAQRAPSCV